MNRVLVIGHRGMLGSALMDLLREKGLRLEEPPSGGKAPASGLQSQACFAGEDLPRIDIADPASVRRVFDRFRPDLVVNCAAYTRVDDAESHRGEAMRVNAQGAGNVASAAAACGAKVVHISTDFVFDGLKSAPYVETDTPHPLSVYGESKAEGERLVAGSAKDFLIVRTAWLYGANGRNFVTTIAEQAMRKADLAVVNDQRGSPTWTRDLSRAIWELCKVGARGIVHASGGPSCSWHEFAVEIVRQLGFEVRVRPITSAEMKRPATRPANSALDTALLRRLTGFEFPRWQDSLVRFLEEWRPRFSKA
jgi:dTDP-4-dehydrorhamnose reductase